MDVVQTLSDVLATLSFDRQHDVLQLPLVVDHQPLVLKNDIDVPLRVHQEVVGSCPCNSTLSLARGNIPDLHLLVVHVRGQKHRSAKLTMVEVSVHLLELVLDSHHD